MTDNDAPLLDIQKLRVSYEARGTVRPAVDGVCLQVRRGEVVAVVGESGSGKTTVGHAVMRLLPPAAKINDGSIRFGGVDLRGLSSAEMRAVRGKRISLIPQDPTSSLNPVIRIGKQVSEILRIHGVLSGRDADDRAVELLGMAGLRDPKLTAGQYPHQLSGGMRQRVLIAIAIGCGPELVIADEPTSALDVTVQRKILDHVDQLVRTTNTAILFITHDLGVAADRANRIVVMHAGKVVESGSVEQILKYPKDPYTRRLLQSAPSLSSRRLISASSPSASHRREVEENKTAALLSVSGLRKSFSVGKSRDDVADVVAVRDASFEVARGETLAIVGESGSGKSTIARMVMRLEQPDQGSIKFDGEDITAAEGAHLRSLRRRFQMVYQNPYASLNPRMSIGEIISEPARLHQVVARSMRKTRVAELLDRVALPQSLIQRKPRELSGGQRQRVAIARALSIDPELLVCDEPVSALDVSVQAQILDLLAELQRDHGLAYLFISHDLAVVKQIAHRVCVMKEGSILETNTTEAIFSDPSSGYTRELLEAIPGTRSFF